MRAPRPPRRSETGGRHPAGADTAAAGGTGGPCRTAGRGGEVRSGPYLLSGAGGGTRPPPPTAASLPSSPLLGGAGIRQGSGCRPPPPAVPRGSGSAPAAVAVGFENTPPPPPPLPPPARPPSPRAAVAAPPPLRFPNVAGVALREAPIGRAPPTWPSHRGGRGRRCRERYTAQAAVGEEKGWGEGSVTAPAPFPVPGETGTDGPPGSSPLVSRPAHAGYGE